MASLKALSIASMGGPVSDLGCRGIETVAWFALVIWRSGGALLVY